MNIYSIYKATNLINGKVYIGFDSNWPNRKSVHKSNLKLDKFNYKFYNALKKYGWDNFQWEVIYQSKDIQHTLNEMESYFIEQYDSFNSGYNMTKGGEGSIGHTYKANPETLKQISKKLKGRIFSEEHKRNMSLSMKGLKKSITHRENVGKAFAHKWIIKNPNGEIIEIQNLRKFCRENNLDQAAMQRVSKGKSKTHKGYTCINLGK